MIEYKIHTDEPGKEWDTLLNQHTRHNPFQTRNMYHMYSQAKDFTPYFCIAQHQDTNKIAGGFLFVIQKSKVPLLGNFLSRALIVGGPLIPKHGRAILEGLLSVYSKFVRGKIIYSEIRNLHQWQHFYDTFFRHGFAYEPHLNYQIDLQVDDIKQHFSASKKRQIRKAEKNGAKIIKNPNLEQVKDFYHILKSLYANKINKPLPDWSFFQAYYHEFVQKDKGIYLLIAYQDKIIGGIMMPFCNNKSAFEWYIAGKDQDYKQLYPSVMATWAGICYAHENNFQYFDFMGAGKPNQPYGVREFKSRFGGKLLNYGRFYKQHKPLIYFCLKIYLKLRNK